MRDLAAIHGVAINRDCVNCGFDWRSGELNRSLSDTFGNIFLRPPKLELAQTCMLSDHKAGVLLRGRPVPARIPVLMEEVNRSPVLSASANSSSCSNMDMVPDFVNSFYANRKRRLKTDQGGPGVVHQKYASDVPDHPWETNVGAARSRRAAGLLSAQRNSKFYQDDSDDTEDDDDGCLSDDDAADWNALHDVEDDGL